VPQSLGENTFVVGLKADGSGAVYSTILPGGNTQNKGIALGAAGEVYVAGLTTDNGVATASGFQTTYQNGTDGYLIKLDTSNHPPTANGGPDQTVPCAGAGVKTAATLDGSGSTDPDLDTLTYHWREGEVPIASSKKPTVQLSAGTHTISLTVVDPFGASSTDTVVINVNCPNHPPTANAGANQNVQCNPTGALTMVTLDGSGSSDPDGDALTYVWTENGQQIATGVNPTVQLSTGTHTITLTVTDTHAASASSTVTVTITCPNRPPVANAGPTQNVPCTGNSTTVQLDGSASSDPDGDALTYVWTENGQQIATGAKPTVQLVNGAHTTTHTITLTVTDTHAASSSANVTININCPNHPPVANAGPDQTLECGGTTTAINLDGSASSDPDGDPLTYAWSENGQQIATGVKPTVNLSYGMHTITLTVTDSHGASSSDTMNVTIQDGTAPVIHCPPDGIRVQQTGPAGAVVDFADKVTATDNCSTPTIVCQPPSGSTFPAGNNLVLCTATDAAGNHSNCVMHVIVVDDTAPTINCPSDMLVTATSPNGATVNFTVTATDNSGTANVTTNPASGSVFPLGDTVVQCTATDASNHTATCSFHVRVVMRDVTAQVQVTAGAPKRTGTGVQIEFTIKNNGDATIPAKAWLVLANLPAGVTLTNKAGASTLATPPPTPVGSPYLAVNVGAGLKFKKSVKVVAKFAKPTSVPTVTYTAQVLAGGGTP
jgi:hypothetical protein